MPCRSHRLVLLRRKVKVVSQLRYFIFIRKRNQTPIVYLLVGFFIIIITFFTARRTIVVLSKYIRTYHSYLSRHLEDVSRFHGISAAAMSTIRYEHVCLCILLSLPDKSFSIRIAENILSSLFFFWRTRKPLW